MAEFKDNTDANTRPFSGIAKSNTVASTSAAYDEMMPRLLLGNTLIGGTESMRGAGKNYLPQYERESDAAYKVRLGSAILVNYYKQTINKMVGKVFEKPITLSQDMPEKYVDYLDDVNAMGDDINVWSQRVFKDAMSKGLVHCLVDMPTQNLPTQADVKAANPRPYLNHIAPENLIAAYSETVNGVEKLTQIRVMEETTTVVGFEEVTTRQIRVIVPSQWFLYQQDSKKKDTWDLVSEGEYDLDYIPLYTFYMEREKFMVGTTPLRDLGHLNVSHWQKTSDKDNTIRVANFPMLAASGLSPQDSEVVVGPNQFLSTTRPDGLFYFVEHSGAAIGSAQKDIADLEAHMASVGMAVLKKRTGSVTATERAIDSSDETSELREASIRFSGFINNCIQSMANWMGEESAGTVSVNTKGLVLNDENGISPEVLLKMVLAKKISHKTFFSELQRRQAISDDLDFEEEQKNISDEPDDLGMFTGDDENDDS